MQTAEKSFSHFLSKHASELLRLCLREGFQFSARESLRCVTVKCTLPNGNCRFIVFDDHRILNPHGEKPHICNQWHKAIGDPLSFTMGKVLTDESRLQDTLLAAAVMCLTQSDAYNEMKRVIFQSSVPVSK